MGFLCGDRVWPRQEILGHDTVFSCLDRVWGKGQESLCHDIVYYVMSVGQGTASQPSCVCVTGTLCRDNVVLCCVVIEKAMHASA